MATSRGDVAEKMAENSAISFHWPKNRKFLKGMANFGSFALDPRIKQVACRVARFFLVQHTETGKNIPNGQKYTKCP
jgi:hypothetical protein